MDRNRLVERLLLIIGLLIGLFIVRFVILELLTSLSFNDYTFTIMNYQHFIGNFIYGLILVAMTRKRNGLSISLGLLSIMSPVYATTLYLLATINPSTNNA